MAVAARALGGAANGNVGIIRTTGESERILKAGIALGAE